MPTLTVATVSQSCQFAPYNAHYSWDNATFSQLHQPEGTQELNEFKGNVYRQAASVVSRTNQLCYEGSVAPCYAVYGFQYKPGLPYFIIYQSLHRGVYQPESDDVERTSREGWVWSTNAEESFDRCMLGGPWSYGLSHGYA
jgi:hypothetical protein